MADHPIIFSAPMVQALLGGLKTQTRRLAWRDRLAGGPGEGLEQLPTPGQRVRRGDRLWVRENILQSKSTMTLPSGEDEAFWHREKVEYCADTPEPQPRFLRPQQYRSPWMGRRPSIHMPRWASRLTLTVTEVRVQRLQEISEEDAIAEGCPLRTPFGGDTGLPFYKPGTRGDAIGWYAGLWEHLHGPGAWEANPEIVALTFTVHQRNIDA